MIFYGSVLLLICVLGAVLWSGLRRTAPASGAGVQLLTVGGFVGLSGLVYALSGQPDYTSPRGASVTEEMGAALRPDGVGPLEAYGALVLAQSEDKAEWIEIAADLQATRRPVEAADAFSRAGALASDPVERASLLGTAGETLVMAKGGMVERDAMIAFAAALKADPDSLGALYYMGREARARGDMAAARPYWSRFLAAAPEGHPLIAEVRGDLALLGEADSAAPRMAPALTEEMVAQFEGLNEEERRAQIVSMLARRQAKLETAGGGAGAEAWRDLARGYLQMGDLDGAKVAYDRAIELAPDDRALELERSQLDR